VVPLAHLITAARCTVPHTWTVPVNVVMNWSMMVRHLDFTMPAAAGSAVLQRRGRVVQLEAQVSLLTVAQLAVPRMQRAVQRPGKSNSTAAALAAPAVLRCQRSALLNCRRSWQHCEMR
jgi:hypothetical protein